MFKKADPSVVSLLKRCIHRGERIFFRYISANGKYSTHAVLPIDFDKRMTLYAIDDKKQAENCFKIAYMEEIQIEKKPEEWIEDHYGKIKSELKDKRI